MRRSAVVVAVCALLIAGCAGSSSTIGPTAGPTAAGDSPVAVESPASAPPAPSPAPSAATVVPKATATAEPTPAIPATGVTIVQEGTSQFELWSPNGQRVLVDIRQPELLTSPPKPADVLLTTHWHSDHYVQSFIDAFPGKTITVQEGALTAGDVAIRSIAAGHNEGDPLQPKDGTDYIFIVDVGGIRVAVFGDLGQDAPTPSQMEALGTVDVAISQLENSYSNVSVSNRKAIAQMDQVRPALVIPTHFDGIPAARMAMDAWPAVTAGRWVTVTRDRLPAATTVLFMGELGPAFRKLLGITTPSW